MFKAEVEDSALSTRAPLSITTPASESAGGQRPGLLTASTQPGTGTIKFLIPDAAISRPTLGDLSTVGLRWEAQEEGKEHIRGGDAGYEMFHMKRSTCESCKAMHHLIALYKDKDLHTSRALQARQRLERDERDVARLLITATRYRESAMKRSEMIEKEKLCESEAIKLVEQRMDAIAALQKQTLETKPSFQQ